MLLAVGELCVGLRATLLFRLTLITDRFVGRIVELSNDYVLNPLLRVLFQRLFDCKDLFLQRIYLVHYLHLGEHDFQEGAERTDGPHKGKLILAQINN